MDDELLKIKKDFRHAHKLIRFGLSEKERGEKSAVIGKKLKLLPEYLTSKNIMFYVSFSTEVNTHEMIKDCLNADKNVYVPVIDLKKKCVHVSVLSDFDDLVESTYGILEPRSECRELISSKKIDIIIVPGLGFDPKGNRIGYGAGFYDTLLNKNKDPLKVALAFECQIKEDVPTGPNDMKMNVIITEKNIYRIRGS
jgi:5-formyltetrahydrofolate cyclo-ligase